MNDDLGLFADDAGEQRGRKARRVERERFRRRKRQRWVTALAGLFVLLLVGAGVLYGASQLLRIGGYEDYQGAGSGEVVIEVSSGDTLSEIGSAMADKGVVASAQAFIEAAEKYPESSGIQPGFYLLKSRMSGDAAMRRILSPEAQAGRVEIRAGMRLEDQLAPNGGHTPGILSKLAKASCTPDGQECVTSAELHRVAATTDLAALGVPPWALEPASQAEPKRRLEGLIMPDLYDVKPGSTPEELLRAVIGQSVAKLEVAGLPHNASRTPYTPYEVLSIASIVQSEAIEKDFGRVSRVIYNRLTPPAMQLQMDSTINYPLDKPSLLTDPADRARPGPYNTYDNFGLPPTPISSASPEAIAAALRPEPGQWLFFVKCYKDGTSCFANNQQEHDAYRLEAERRGAY